MTIVVRYQRFSGRCCKRRYARGMIEWGKLPGNLARVALACLGVFSETIIVAALDLRYHRLASTNEAPVTSLINDRNVQNTLILCKSSSRPCGVCAFS